MSTEIKPLPALERFARLVKEMRDAQCHFFVTRDNLERQIALTEAKRLERLVDAEINRIMPTELGGMFE